MATMPALEDLKWTCIRTFANTALYVRSSSWFSPATQPDCFKTYECRPHLYACRVFTPRGHDGQRPLPLVIRAHGGGFIVNAPAADDPIARHLADNANCIVVSIDYSKAPQNKFPAAYEDVVAQSLAVIDDQGKDRWAKVGSEKGSQSMLRSKTFQTRRSRDTC